MGGVLGRRFWATLMEGLGELASLPNQVYSTIEKLNTNVLGGTGIGSALTTLAMVVMVISSLTAMIWFVAGGMDTPQVEARQASLSYIFKMQIYGFLTLLLLPLCLSTIKGIANDYSNKKLSLESYSCIPRTDFQNMKPIDISYCMAETGPTNNENYNNGVNKDVISGDKNNSNNYLSKQNFPIKVSMNEYYNSVQEKDVSDEEKANNASLWSEKINYFDKVIYKDGKRHIVSTPFEDSVSGSSTVYKSFFGGTDVGALAENAEGEDNYLYNTNPILWLIFLLLVFYLFYTIVRESFNWFINSMFSLIMFSFYSFQLFFNRGGGNQLKGTNYIKQLKLYIFYQTNFMFLPIFILVGQEIGMFVNMLLNILTNGIVSNYFFGSLLDLIILYATFVKGITFSQELLKKVMDVEE